MPRYEFQEGTSSKFWEITLLGKSFTTKFGKIGSNGQTKLKEHANEAAAKAEYEKLIAEKTKKGYALVGNGKPAKASTNAQYFEYKDGTSSKFWEITLDGTRHTVRFGKIGSAGQTSVKTFKNAAAAREDYAALVKEKTKKGYVQVGGAAVATDPTLDVQHATNDKLEAAIRSNPDDPDAYLVYADWLQSQNDPRGELIVLQHGKKAAPAKKLLEKYKRHFFGKLADAQAMLVPYPYDPLGRATEWRWGYLESLWISDKYDRDEGDLEAVDVEDALGWMLDHPSCKFLRELTVGIVTIDDSNSYAGIAKVIGARKLPTLKKLILGDFYYEETELNWSDLGNLEPMYKALPNLESLTLRSGSMKIGKIDLPKLKELRTITGGLDKKSLANICAAKWPHLETLNLQLGDEGSPAIKLADLQPIFDARAFPKVKHLGLGNSDLSDKICEALARSKIAAQLESLDLSKGTLGDAGANALAAGRFPKLQLLDVTENWLTKAGIKALAKVAKTVEYKGGRRGGQQDDGGEAENRYIAARE